MTQSTNLDVQLIDPNQLGKATTANAAFNAFCDTMAKTLTVDASIHATPYTIPYSAAEGGDKTALQFVKLKITGALSGAWTGIVPAKNHFFFIENATTGGFATTVKVTGLTGVVVPAGSIYLVYNNGTDVTLIAAATQWRTGSGVPSNSLGLDGDLYLNTANGDYYLRSGGTYSVQGSLLGAFGGGFAFEAVFDSSTTNSDPGSGNLRINNATENTGTALYISKTDANGATITASLAELDASTNANKGYIRIFNKKDVTKWLQFKVTARVDHTNYSEITVVNVTSSAASPFSASDKLVWSFARTGDGIGSVTTTIVAPQGRLTLQTVKPVMTADQTAKSTVYYDSYKGNLCPLYSGSAWAMFAIGGDEISTGLDAVTPHVAANALYDIFAVNNSGTLAIGVGPAWLNTATITVTIASPAVVSWTGHGLPEGAPVVFTTSGALPTGITAGTTYFVSKSPGANSFNISTTVANAAAGTLVNTSGSQSGTHTGTNNTTIRGTGAGTTELQLLNGIWTNKNSLTHLWSGASGTTDLGAIAANQGTYLGTIYGTAAGQTGVMIKPAAATGGNNTIIGLWNAYNRVPIETISRDSTGGNINYSNNTWQATDGSVANRITKVDGLGESETICYAQVGAFMSATTTSGGIGINQNSTTATPGVTAYWSATFSGIMNCEENYLPMLGLTYFQAMEARVFGAGTNTYQYNAVTQAQALTALTEY